MNNIQKLKIIQKISKLTQERLALKLGVSFVTFHNWINGKAMPRAKAVKKIDQLYQEYTGEKEIPADILIAKKQIIVTKAKKQKNILTKILARQDIYKEFILALTFHSNRIEGSTLTEGETGAILFENAVLPNKTLVEQMEVKNHQAALEYLFNYLAAKKPINEELILRLHAILLNGIDSGVGFYRHHGVRILGANVPTANYLKVPELIKDLIKDVQIGKEDVVAQSAEVHARFEQIHPFGDGNGRIGRLILQAMLLRANLVPAIIKQENKVFYLQYLNKAQMQGDFTLLEDFFCEAILEGFGILEK